MVIIGIDPGAGGAICQWNRAFVSVDKCPDNAKNMSSIVLHIKNNSWVDDDGKCIAYIEKVWGRPSNATRAAFHFGENYGRWQGVLESHKIPINYILPNKWIKYWAEEYDVELPKGEENYRARKNKLKELASFQTETKTTLWNSDAILIAAYGYRMEQEK